ncbi:30S ribosomal protein S20 [Candidatus Dojkabacteria bacterium]|nr:30S ribosomal protein S20 [Candidatus Dojkabacteria bacterium]
MANLKSSKKAVRVQKRKRVINLVKIDAYKKARKTILDLLNKGELKEAEKQLPTAYKAIDKTAKNNTIHQNKAARLKARLAAKLKAAKETK